MIKNVIPFIPNKRENPKLAKWMVGHSNFVIFHDTLSFRDAFQDVLQLAI